jgi:hypothetical protein
MQKTAQPQIRTPYDSEPVEIRPQPNVPTAAQAIISHFYDKAATARFQLKQPLGPVM